MQWWEEYYVELLEQNLARSFSFLQSVFIFIIILRHVTFFLLLLLLFLLWNFTFHLKLNIAPSKVFTSVFDVQILRNFTQKKGRKKENSKCRPFDFWKIMTISKFCLA